jgi:hypothetical protein
MSPGLRFFGPGSAALELEKLIATVRADGAVPSQINLGGTFDTEVVLETLRHLARYWAPNPPSRNEERRASVSRMSVVHDFDEIVSTVSGETVNLSFDSSVELWTVENESENGYGALMPQARSDWLHVGTLLGVKLEDGASWGVGIVRRMSAFDHKQRYVGIQVLTKGATVVKLDRDQRQGRRGTGKRPSAAVQRERYQRRIGNESAAPAGSIFAAEEHGDASLRARLPAGASQTVWKVATISTWRAFASCSGPPEPAEVPDGTGRSPHESAPQSKPFNHRTYVDAR